jgi:hypothetical protein
VTGISTTSLAVTGANAAVAGTLTAAGVKVGGTDPLTAVQVVTAWAPVKGSTASSNLSSITVGAAQFTRVNKQVTAQLNGVQLTFTGANATAPITLPAGHVPTVAAAANVAFTLASGTSNLYTGSTNNRVGNLYVQTGGLTASGSVIADPTTSNLLFTLANFQPGTWTCDAVLITYTIA